MSVGRRQIAHPTKSANGAYMTSRQSANRQSNTSGKATCCVARAADARESVRLRYTDRQQAFIGFVLDQYTKEGVGELDGDKLAPLLKLRYKNAIADATADLGNPDQIRGLFIGFQRYLYEPSGAYSQA